MPSEPRKPVLRRILVWLLVILTVLELVPLLSVLATALVANVLGCQVDEGSIHPCLFAGTDLGGLLYSMGMMGWLFILTAPLMVLVLLGWILIGGLAVWRAVRRR
jgi:hypothetical protein